MTREEATEQINKAVYDMDDATRTLDHLTRDRDRQIAGVAALRAIPSTATTQECQVAWWSAMLHVTNDQLQTQAALVEAMNVNIKQMTAAREQETP